MVHLGAILQQTRKERAVIIQAQAAASEKEHRHLCGELYMPVEVEVVATTIHREANLASTYRCVTVKGSNPTPFLAELYLPGPRKNSITIDELSGPEFVIPRVGDKAILDWNEKEEHPVLLRIKPTGK